MNTVEYHGPPFGCQMQRIDAKYFSIDLGHITLFCML